MSAKEDMELKKLMNEPRGTDVSIRARKGTVIGTTTVAAKITVTANKVVYVRGINYIDHATLEDHRVRLSIDRGTTDGTEVNKIFKTPPGPATKFDEIDCFKPPLKAYEKVEILVAGTTTFNVFKSFICAFEAEQ